jgi:coniferyl-aldehyde dehydrogenase
MHEAFRLQREAFLATPAPTVAARKEHIHALVKAVLLRREEIISVIGADFGGRCREETLLAEILATVSAGKYAIRNVSEWARRRQRSVQLPLQPARAWVEPQPRGVIGIVSPWNFPVNAALIPLISALAAGNRVMLKPSEYTPATSRFLAKVIDELFPADQVKIVEGDVAIGREFVALPFDHLIFTGSTEVGKQVMRAASEHLTPLTLELGGKSPAIIAPSADVRRAADDIAYGKIANAGQICLAPDYVLIGAAHQEAFVEAFSAAVRGYLIPDATHVANEKNYLRLQAHLEEARRNGVKIVQPVPSAGRLMTPAILIDPPADSQILQEEIFGPLLILRTCESVVEAVRIVNDGGRPLALYIFAKDRKEIATILSRTVSGSVGINGVLTQALVDDLPFGGVGTSGMGQYHGAAGFDTFSHLKPVLETRGRSLTTLFRRPRKNLAPWLMRTVLRWEEWRLR